MPKSRITITVEDDVLEQIDRLAETRKQNRSQCIESLCASAMDQGKPATGGMMEMWAFRGPTTAVLKVVGKMWLDDKKAESPIPTEIIVRQDAETVVKRLRDFLERASREQK